MNRRIQFLRGFAAVCCLLLFSNCGGDDDCGCGSFFVTLHGETEKAWKLERVARYDVSGDVLLSESAPPECEADDRLVLNEARAWFSRYGAAPCAEGGMVRADGPQNQWSYNSRDDLLIFETEGGDPVIWEVDDVTEDLLVLWRETEDGRLEHTYAAAP